MSKRYEMAKKFTQKYKSVLSPCKYCGCDDIEIVSDRTIFDPKNVWDVVCPSCGHCICGRNTVRDAVRGWNDNVRGR